MKPPVRTHRGLIMVGACPLTPPEAIALALELYNAGKACAEAETTEDALYNGLRGLAQAEHESEPPPVVPGVVE